jgi:hypothetical protein
LKLADIPRYQTSFLFNDSLSLPILSQLSNVEEAKLAALMYPTAELIRRKMGDYLVFGSAVQQYLIRPDRLKICPGCLRESGYARKMWELIPVTVCPIHKCLLLDECPNCNARLTWIRESISQCRCEFDWREYCTPLVEENELLVTEQIYRLCNLISTGSKQKKQFNSNPLYQLELRHFLSALLFVASQYGGFIDTKGKFIVSLKQNIEIHTLICKAFLTFDDWPENFFSFLDWRRTQNVNEKFTRGLGREFREYKSVLYRQLSSKQFDFMRSAFEEYLVTHWKGGYLSRMTRLSDDALKNTKYLSMNAARKLLKTSYVYELIEAGRLNAIVQKQGRKNLVLVERRSLETFKRELEQSLNMKQLCSFLALSKMRIRELVKAGLLNPLHGPSVDGFDIWKFNIDEAENILKAFKDKLISNKISDPRLNLLQVLMKIDQYGVDLSVFIRGVLSGEICPCGTNKNKGLAKFLFSRERVTAFLKCKSQLRGEEAYSVEAVTKLIKASKRAVWFLIRNDFIRAQKLSNSSSAGLIIKKSDLELFSSTFVLAKDIASQLNATPGYISELLITHGIHPVLSRKIHKGPLIIFKKSDLDGIDLVSLVTLTKSEARIVLPCPFKRGEAVTLNETQAADALGIAVDKIDQLVERGVLKLHRYKRPSKEGAEKYCFPARTIEKWKGQSIDCTSIVAFLIAAKMIGSGPEKFYRKYIRTGRLKAVITGKQRSEHYFLLADVEAVIKLNEQTITSSEAAMICKVNFTCIQKLIVAGALKPISGPSVDGFGYNLYLRTDVERLHAEREAFKAKRKDEGGASRFGRPAGPKRQPVRNEIGPRIEQLVKKWTVKPKGQPISGQRLHRQLVKEGYQVGISTIYVCLRELRQQTHAQ